MALAKDSSENRIACAVITAAIEVHRHLGPGLYESAYETALSHELLQIQMRHRRQVALSARYKDLVLADAYRIDLFVEDLVIVEIKALDALHPIHKSQLLTYLRFSGARLGLLLNFCVPVMKSGIHRLINA